MFSPIVPASGAMGTEGMHERERRAASIASATTLEQLDDILCAAALRLPPEALARLDQASA